ncbi:MAG TPA: hypothetical protein VGK10_02175 [Prolixibacteraceae bacterium]|jgi:large-conductance mechanosensitive channel
MNLFPNYPFVNFVISAVIFFIIIQWVNTFVALRKEQNDLLREIIQKMDHQPKV